MKTLVIVSALILTCWARVACAQPGAGLLDQRVELQPTDTMIELEAEFVACRGKKTFKVQDGAMNVLAPEGGAPARFIVKRQNDGDVVLHMVESRTFNTLNGPTPGLIVRGPVSLLNSQGASELARVGLASLSYRSSYPLSAATSNGAAAAVQSPGAATPQSGANNCCAFRGCGGAVWTFCTTGAAGCGGDDCGACCVTGRIGPTPQ